MYPEASRSTVRYVNRPALSKRHRGRQNRRLDPDHKSPAIGRGNADYVPLREPNMLTGRNLGPEEQYRISVQDLINMLTRCTIGLTRACSR